MGAIVKTSRNSEHEVFQKFANDYSLRVKRDECGDRVISGRRGNLYEYGPTELGLMVMPEGNDPSPRLWKLVLAKCSRAGMTLRQWGDAEGAFSFDPENPDHARLAIAFAGVRPKRRISPAHLAKLLAGKSRSRSEAILQGAL